MLRRPGTLRSAMRGRCGQMAIERGPLGLEYRLGAVAELADAGDLKSSEGNLVWVRFPPAPPSAGLSPKAVRGHRRRR